MAFTNNFRIERIYFEKLKSNIDILKSYIEAGATGEALELLKNSVDVDGAVLLLYRNLGEAWAELADLIQKTQKDLKDLAEKTEAYHDELNERIDEVNNYLMALIRELDARLQAVEQDLATMNRNKFYDLVENNGSYHIEKDGETVSFDDIKADADFPHDVILRYDNGTSVTELEIREFTDSRIDFYSIGLADSDTTVKEILVSIANTEAVTYYEHTLENPLYTFGTGLSLDSDNELSVDFNTVQAKLTEGTGIDIDSNNVISVDTTVIQEKLTEGTGIDINSNNEISVDTSVIQEKLTAGNNISITNNVISATDTTYSEGTGIDIDSNNVISADTSVLQEKLTAGSGIAIDPVTNEISNTAQGAQYTFDYPLWASQVEENKIIKARLRANQISQLQSYGEVPIANGLTGFHHNREVTSNYSASVTNLYYLMIETGLGFDIDNSNIISKINDFFTNNPDVKSFTLYAGIQMLKETYTEIKTKNIVQKFYKPTGSSFSKDTDFVGDPRTEIYWIYDRYEDNKQMGDFTLSIGFKRYIGVEIDSPVSVPALNGWNILSTCSTIAGSENRVKIYKAGHTIN